MNLYDSAALAARVQDGKLPPVDRWNPPFSGEMNLYIARDGTWWHEGVPIRRDSLLRLFSTLLRREEDGYHYLLTPVEKWRIQVEDAPFLAVWMDIECPGNDQVLHFRTNLGDTISAGPDHSIKVKYALNHDEPSPYVHVRSQLWALLSRTVFLELANLAIEKRLADKIVYGVYSHKIFFPLDDTTGIKG